MTRSTPRRPRERSIRLRARSYSHRARACIDALETRQLLCSDHAGALEPTPEMLAEKAARYDTGGLEAGLESAWTTGNKTVLYIRVNFTDATAEPQTLANATTMMTDVDNYIRSASGGLTSFTTTFTSLITMPQTLAYYASLTNGDFTLRSDALNAAKALNPAWDSTLFDQNAVRWNGGPGSYAGQAYVGWSGTWLKSSSSGVAAHEFGHNLGLWHSNYWNPSDPSTIVGPGSDSEYGDIFSTMGSATDVRKHFTVYEKWDLDWLSSAQTPLITSDGTYRIWAHDINTTTVGYDASKLYGLRIKRDAERDYWIEFRQNALFNNNRFVQNGIQLRWDAWSQSNSGGELLDTTPLSPDGKDDAGIVAGRTFTDPIYPINVTALSKDPSNPAFDVRITFGKSAAAPTIDSLTPDSSVAVNASLAMSVSATDADGDTLAYAWDFGDRTFSTTNSPNVTKSWSAAGTYRVRVTVSDMRGRTATKSLLVTVGAPSANVQTISGRVVDTTGNGVAGAIVHNGLATNDASYRYTLTDDEGRYFLTNVPAGAFNVTALVPGSTVTRVGFVNPVVSGANPDWINFRAAPNVWRITGKVTDASGANVAGAIVSNGITSEPTNPSGVYVLTGVGLGEYVVTATKPGQTFQTNYSPTGPVQVAYADRTTIDFREVGATLPIRVTGAAVGETVTLRVGNTTVTSSRQGGSGTGGNGSDIWFYQSISLGSTQLAVYSSSGSYSPVGFNPLYTVTSSNPTLVFTKDAVQTFGIGGTVRHLSQPLAGATVSLPGGITTTTDRSGAYWFGGLSAGSYVVSVSAPGYTFSTSTRNVTISSASVLTQDFATSSANAAPTIVNAATAVIDAGEPTRVNLSVLAADDNGETLLTYDWSTTATPAGSTVTFPIDASNGAKNAYAVINRAGTYTFRVTVRDATNATRTSDVTLVVSPTVTGITLTPAAPTVFIDTVTPLVASTIDQFGQTIAAATDTVWNLVSGVGSIDAAGSYTAPTFIGGSALVLAQSGSFKAAGAISVVYPNGPGFGIQREVYTNVTGSGVAALTSNANFPNAPSSRNLMTSSSNGLFEVPTNIGDNYGQRLRGYFIAPATGAYTFYIASDDAADLYLSTDDSPANKSRISFNTGSTGNKEWTKVASQKSASINLVVGQRYYIEALHKENTGSDHLAVRVDLPGGIVEAPIPAHRIEPFASMSAAGAFDAIDRSTVGFTFADDVTTTVSIDDLALVNTTTGRPVPTSALTFAYDAITRRATWRPTALLESGNFVATIARANVRDTFGGTLAQDATLNFSFQRGDANLDRTVNFDDLLVLAANYNQSGPAVTLSQGDFDYDADVDFDDLLILAASYNATLPTAGPASVPITLPADEPVDRPGVAGDIL